MHFNAFVTTMQHKIYLTRTFSPLVYDQMFRPILEERVANCQVVRYGKINNALSLFISLTKIVSPVNFV